MTKRPLDEIQSDVERAEEEQRVVFRRLEKLREEQRRNDDFQKREEFRRLFGDTLFKRLFDEGTPPLIDLKQQTVEHVKRVVAELQRWRDAAVAEVKRDNPHANRTVIRSEAYEKDQDPYDCRPIMGTKTSLYSASMTEEDWDDPEHWVNVTLEQRLAKIPSAAAPPPPPLGQKPTVAQLFDSFNEALQGDDDEKVKEIRATLERIK